MHSSAVVYGQTDSFMSTKVSLKNAFSFVAVTSDPTVTADEPMDSPSAPTERVLGEIMGAQKSQVHPAIPILFIQVCINCGCSYSIMCRWWL